MNEVRVKKHILHDGTQINTYQSEIGAHVVEAGTTGYQGDNSENLNTFVRLESFDRNYFGGRTYVGQYGSPGIELVLGGDSQLADVIECLEFILRVLKDGIAGKNWD